MRLNDEEREVMQHIRDAMQGIESWGLKANHSELAMHVHGMQGFVIQHMLGRDPEGEWANWYDK